MDKEHSNWPKLVVLKVYIYVRRMWQWKGCCLFWGGRGGEGRGGAGRGGAGRGGEGRRGAGRGGAGRGGEGR